MGTRHFWLMTSGIFVSGRLCSHLQLQCSVVSVSVHRRAKSVHLRPPSAHFCPFITHYYLFRDCISNCTNLFRPEPNWNHTRRSAPHLPSDVHTDLIGRAHLTVCSLTPPSVYPSTKDRRYQHAVYMVLCAKWASVGKL